MKGQLDTDADFSNLGLRIPRMLPVQLQNGME